MASEAPVDPEGPFGPVGPVDPETPVVPELLATAQLLKLHGVMVPQPLQAVGTIDGANEHEVPARDTSESGRTEAEAEMTETAKVLGAAQVA